MKQNRQFTLIEFLVTCQPSLPVKGRSPIRARFTLIKLLVVIAIIGVLAAMLLPALSRARGAAQHVLCFNNVKQFHLMHTLYVDDYDGYIPYARYEVRRRPQIT